MQVIIQSQGFVPIDGLRAYIEQRLAYGLGRIARRVVGVVVELIEGASCPAWQRHALPHPRPPGAGDGSGGG